MTIIIKSRAPLRLGLAGGGTDVAPYCDVYGGNVLNATLDRYAYTVIRLLEEPSLIFESTDLNQSECLNSGDDVQIEGALKLHRAVYKHIVQNYNFGKPIPLRLTTFCDAPIGSGLGSSSTVVVSMIKAFVELLNLPLDDYDIARMSYQIERVECGLQGGRQDQYSATFGGFNFMEFHANGKDIVNPLRIKSWVLNELESSLVLFSTGISRESANIIEAQSKNLSSGEQDALSAMHGIKEEAIAMKECILRGDFLGLVDSLKKGWENKKKSAKTVSNPFLDGIYESAINQGALAGKISGAGGGGFMLFYVPTEYRMNVIRALEKFEGQVSNCHFTVKGAEAWRN